MACDTPDRAKSYSLDLGLGIFTKGFLGPGELQDNCGPLPFTFQADTRWQNHRPGSSFMEMYSLLPFDAYETCISMASK